jgi:hypothetical protein
LSSCSELWALLHQSLLPTLWNFSPNWAHVQYLRKGCQFLAISHLPGHPTLGTTAISLQFLTQKDPPIPQTLLPTYWIFSPNWALIPQTLLPIPCNFSLTDPSNLRHCCHLPAISHPTELSHTSDTAANSLQFLTYRALLPQTLLSIPCNFSTTLINYLK